MAQKNVHIPLQVGGRDAGELEFVVTHRESGVGQILRLELDDDDLRAELELLLKAGNPRNVRVRSIVANELATSLDGVIAALGTLAEEHPKGARAFTYDAGEAKGKFGTFWGQPGILV